MRKDLLSETVWRTPTGEAVSCIDKLKVLNENLGELRDMAQDALSAGSQFGHGVETVLKLALSIPEC